MKNAVLWDDSPCGSLRTEVSKDIAFIIRVRRIGELGTTLAVTSSVLRLLVITDVPISQILVTLMMETMRSSGMSVLKRGTRCDSQKKAFFKCPV
jgi:hypothetical protein